MLNIRHALLLAFLLLPCILHAQFFPKEGRRLNYRLIGFSFPGVSGNSVVEIASGYQNNEASFEAHLLLKQTCTTNKAALEVPEFGSNYTWRISQPDKNTKKDQPELHHFSTLSNPSLDTGVAHLRIISNKENRKDIYVFVDALAALYDLNGNMVWFLPGLDQASVSYANIRDLKITPSGTITYLSGDKAYEIDYDGNILWSTPNTGEVSGEHTERYHHEFTKLSNGHYMILGNEPITLPLPLYHIDSTLPSQDGTIFYENDTFRQKLSLGTVVEYDKDGKVSWSWKSSGYFKHSDLFNHYTANGRFPVGDVHENSFYFDEKNKLLYVGFRDISRIVKVKYPTGTVISEYGTRSKPGVDELCNELFCGQHSIGKRINGDIYLFNNNSLSTSAKPKIEILRETGKPKNPLLKIWEYTCTTDGMTSEELSLANKKNEKIQFMAQRTQKSLTKLRMSSGGNVIEMRDGSFFCSMSGDFGKMFIIKSNSVNWSAVAEKINTNNSTWMPLPTYRASIIEGNAMEQLLFHASLSK